MNLSELNGTIAILTCMLLVTMILNGVVVWWHIARKFDKEFPEYVNNKAAFENG